METIFIYYGIGVMAFAGFIIYLRYLKRKIETPEYESKEQLDEAYKKELDELTKEYKQALKSKVKSQKKVDVKKKIEKKVSKPVETEIEPVKEMEYTKKKSWMDFNKIKQHYYRRFKPHKTVLINLELINGNFRTFLIIEKEGKFTHDDKTYVLDNESKYYNLDLKQWCFDYHEEYALPLKRIVPVSDIKKQLELDPNIEVEYASNPATLERFVVARIAEGIMKGQQLDDWMKQIRLMCVIIAIAVIIHLLLFMQKSGMLDSVTGTIGI